MMPASLIGIAKPSLTRPGEVPRIRNYFWPSLPLQLFVGESRAGTTASHGSQTLAIGADTPSAVGFGPGLSLAATGATALKIEAPFTATNSFQTVTLTHG
jgi:hypothetical protein